MIGLLPPPLVFHERCWSTEVLTGMATAWRDSLGKELHASGRPIAMVMANHPQSVALLFALSSFPAPLILLPPDLRPWRSSPPLPADTRLVLLREQQHLEADARSLDLDVTILSDPDEARGVPDKPAFMTMPGLVLFTSGSTARPRPVYRRTASLLRLAQALVATVGLPRGGGLIATLPLARAFGLNHGLLAAAVLRSPLALLDHFDHKTLLRLFASREYQYWAGTPMMADVLGRCPLPGSHPAPPICVVGGRLSADVARRFRERFDVSLRQCYGTTETGSIALDVASADDVRSDTAGRPMPGVAVRIGDDPRVLLPAGTPGRIWLSTTEYMMDGYGFPPRIEPPEMIDGWWGTPDTGTLDARGHLTVSGRVDDCFRTDAGRIVSPASVAAALDSYPGVIETAVVPLAGSTGPVLGILVESDRQLSVTDLRWHLSRSLPAWSQPRVIETTGAIPRLSSGRIDRRACIAILEKSRAGDNPGDVRQ
jgi:acyl-CoA synthetase (AMP-forming)/AMP-acid ligase II